MKPTPPPPSLERREVPLAMDAATFKTLGHALIDQLADLLASVPSRPLTRGESPSEVRRALEPEFATDNPLI